jgi:hypothetical protein
MYLGGGFEKPATVAFVVDEATVAAAANGAQQADVGAGPGVKRAGCRWRIS